MKKLVIFCLFTMFYIGGAAQSDKEKTETTVDQNMIKGQIHFLCLDALKGRDTGSPGLELAADFLESQLKLFGVNHAPGMETFRQVVPFSNILPASKAEFSINGISLNRPDDFFIMDGDNAIVDSKDIVFVNFGLKEDLKDLDVKGKLVVANAGNGESEDPQSWYFASIKKNELVSELGATGIIELYYNPKAPYNFVKRFLAAREQTILGHDNDQKTAIPHLMIDASKENIVSQLKSGNASIHIEIDGMSREEFTSDNIVGFIEGSDPVLKDEIVVYSAHYDHVGIGQADMHGDTIYNGARDNAVGTTTVLSVAENIGKFKTKRSALFILFTAEEKGLLGSQWFVDHSPVELQKIVYCFNSDNGGYNDITKASIVGLERTTAEPLFKEACNAFGLTAIEDAAKEQGLFDRSDNVNFAAKGIPAPTFSMGFTAFDAEILKYYHQAGDHADNLDYDYLFKFFKSYVLSARLIANTEKTPFWIDGDKYTELGKALYGIE